MEKYKFKVCEHFTRPIQAHNQEWRNCINKADFYIQDDSKDGLTS
jgi:hypothetical protein